MTCNLDRQNSFDNPNFINGARVITEYQSWLDQKGCDVVIKTRQGDIMIHSLILCAHSEAFRRFINEQQQGQMTQIMIDSEQEVVNSVIKFCYIADIYINESNLLQVQEHRSLIAILYFALV